MIRYELARNMVRYMQVNYVFLLHMTLTYIEIRVQRGNKGIPLNTPLRLVECRQLLPHISIVLMNVMNVMNQSTRIKRSVITLLTSILTISLSGCITVGPDYDAKKTAAQAQQPETWSTTLPHAGSVDDLTQWWSQFNDPILVELVSAAQKQSATTAEAALRIAQSRAVLISINAAALPNVNSQASFARGTTMLGGPIILGNTTQAQVQASWELDLFGGLRRGSESAQAKLTADIANWHVVRLSVAADTANYYTNYRSCEQLLNLAIADADSRAQTARLTTQLADAGFQAPASAALAQASAAEGTGRRVAQQAECDLLIQVLVAMTSIEHNQLRTILKPTAAQLPIPKAFVVDSIPANVLVQRPDIMAAEQQLIAANADIGARIAERLPKLSISGNIGPLNFTYDGGSINGTSWIVGPSISLPIFDAGRRLANEQTAWVAYQTAEIKFRAQVRLAVREVEEALVRLNSLKQREREALAASKGYHITLTAFEEKYKFGLASVLDLEETRRLSFNADNILAGTQRDHVNAWIALYRSVGGGWTTSELTIPASAYPTPVLLTQGTTP